MRKILGAGLAAIILLLSALLVARWKPPELVRIGANYAAKIVCSNVFLANRDPADVLRTDVQAPGHPLLKLMRVDVDRAHGIVRASVLGLIGGGLAVARPGVGCAVMPDGSVAAARGIVPPVPASREASLDRDVIFTTPALENVIADDALTGPGMRAVVISNKGKLVAERYGRGFDWNTPQLGWSMTKSVMAGLIGLLVKDGRLSLHQARGLGAGSGAERVTIADLMTMTSGLRFDEGYGAVSDVTRMLYLEPDMAGFARAKPLIHPPGQVWSYSSGSAVILSRVFQDTVGGDGIAFMQTRLFGPLGMTSAVVEADEKGTLVGSSYMYATPRDWARYGQMLAQNGVWEGQQILPRDYVAMMVAPVAASGGEYGQGMVWRRATHGAHLAKNTDAASALPADIFWMSGHDGQYVAVIPSRRLVIVRMGLTPARERYRPEPLVRAVLGALQ